MTYLTHPWHQKGADFEVGISSARQRWARPNTVRPYTADLPRRAGARADLKVGATLPAATQGVKEVIPLI